MTSVVDTICRELNLDDKQVTLSSEGELEIDLPYMTFVVKKDKTIETWKNVEGRYIPEVYDDVKDAIEDGRRHIDYISKFITQ